MEAQFPFFSLDQVSPIHLLTKTGLIWNLVCVKHLTPGKGWTTWLLRGDGWLQQQNIPQENLHLTKIHEHDYCRKQHSPTFSEPEKSMLHAENLQYT